MRKASKRLLTIVMAAAITMSMFFGVPAGIPGIAGIPGQADTAQAKSKNRTLKLDYKVDTLLRDEKTSAVYAIRYYHSKAKYTYRSGNKKVATVNKKGLIRGVRAGRAKITIKERYKGKTRKAILTIRVINATLDKRTIEMYREYDPESNNLDFYINNILPKARYVFTSMDKSRLTVTAKGVITVARKIGTVKVAVKEIYKKKTRHLGYLRIKVIPPEFEANGKTEKLKLSDEDYNYLDIFNDLIGGTYIYTVICETKAELDEYKNNPSLLLGDGSNDDAVLRFEEEDGEWTGMIEAIATGTRYIGVFDQVEDETPMFIGWCKVVVRK